jgi:hypothetical protein
MMSTTCTLLQHRSVVASQFHRRSKILCFEKDRKIRQGKKISKEGRGEEEERLIDTTPPGENGEKW